MDLLAGKRRTPCPDPENYVWVQTKEGGFWRKKRGTIKKAVLNEKFRLSSEHTKISSPAARRIVSKLRPYLTGLLPGRLTARISGKLRKALNETGKLNFTYLQDFDLQTDHPMTRLLLAPWKCVTEGDELVVTIPVGATTIKQHSRLVTGYYFELILLWGDAGSEYGLKADSETSELFAIGETRKIGCRLSTPLPKEPWVALLKVSCMEGNELAAANRNYGMKVVGMG